MANYANATSVLSLAADSVSEGRPSNMKGYGSLHDRLLELLKASPKLLADVTRAPILDAGRRKIKTGHPVGLRARSPALGRPCAAGHRIRLRA
jgi:hypothetical protein